MTRKRLGFFTRLLDHTTPKERYRLATEQIRHAERLGFDSAWIAQHHFHEHEGGLPSPLVFLAHAAAHTERIRLGTAIITLPMENPLRVAEDAAVLDLLGRQTVALLRRHLVQQSGEKANASPHAEALIRGVNCGMAAISSRV